MHNLTKRPLRTLVVGVATFWILLISMSTGLVSALFPASITIASPKFYVWASRSIDPVASLLLICLVFMAMIRVRRNSHSDSILIEHPNPSATDVAAHAIATPRQRNQEGNLTFAKPKGGIFHGEGPRRIVLVTVLAGAVLAASQIDRALTDDHPSASLVNSAVSLSTSGQITPALESLMQVMPRNFTPSAFNLYYFASGWESLIRAWTMAEKLDVLLVRSSIAIKNPQGLVVGLIQYDQVKETPFPRSVEASLISSVTSSAWRNTVKAALAWQRSGATLTFIKNLEATSKISRFAVRVEFQQAIDYVKSYSSVD